MKKNGFFVEVTNIRTNSRKMNKLRNVYTIGREARNTRSRNEKLTSSKTMPFVIDRSKFEKRASVSKVFALFN